MKKIITLVLTLLLVPFFASASLDTNLYYGLRNNSDVRELQEFLIDKGFLTGSTTGNFLSLTLKAVKQYQASVGIIQTGYVGTLTRTAINNELATNLQGSNQEATNETGTTPPNPATPATTNDVVASLQTQIALLTQQLQIMQTQQTVTQQIAQNTAPTAQTCIPNWVCSSWSVCTDNLQTRSCSDSNGCGISTGKPTLAQNCGTEDLTVSCSGTVDSLDDPNYTITFTSSVSGGTGNYQYYWDSGYWGRTEISKNDPKCFINGYPCPSMTFCDKVGTLNEGCPMTGESTFTGKSQSIGPSSINFNIENKERWYWPEKQRWSTKNDLLNISETLFVKSGDEIVGVHCPINVSQ